MEYPVSTTWEHEASKCRDILLRSIPEQYKLADSQLPPPSRLNVLGVPAESGRLSSRELLITETCATDLVAHMADGTWTAEEVTVAYLKRATIGQQLLNFATEFLADEALECARALDKHYHDTGKIKGPLHGVPISVKEHVGIGGRICHTGYVALTHNIAAEDAMTVQLLRNAGVVILLRTNEPQSLMHGDTDNNLTGATLSPQNRLLSVGGSSGGEGASIAFGGSAIGVGTDIGGSIRIPSSFNGVYGFRPTALRLPYNGVHTVAGGQEALRSVIGPLARSVDDLELFMRSVLDQKPWDVAIGLAPLPWAPKPDMSSMSIGIMRSNGHVNPTPPMRRALRYAEQKLKAAGFRIVEWLPYRHQDAFDLLVRSRPSSPTQTISTLTEQGSLFFADGAKSHREVLAKSGEPVLPLTSFVMDGAEAMSFDRYWKCNAEREALREEYHRLMKDRGVDVILCPPTNGSATRRNNNQYWFYTGLWNILDQPAAVFPTGLTVDPNLDPTDTDYTPLNPIDQRESEKYDPELFAGSPLCLQVAGKHFHDEEVLAATRIIEKAIRS